MSKILFVIQLVFNLFAGLISAQPLLTCHPATPAGFEVTHPSASHCTQPCPTIHIQGLPLEPPCAEHAWYLNGALLSEVGSAFCLPLPDIAGPYTLRHEMRRRGPDSVWHSTVAECLLPPLPCCGGPEAAFQAALLSVDSSAAPHLARVAVTYTGTGAPPAHVVFENAGAVLYEGTAWPDSLQHVPFGRPYDRLCLRVRAADGCESRYCLRIDDLPTGKRTTQPERTLSACRLYPNPTAGVLRVDYTGETPAQLALYLGTGALALQQPLSANATTAVEVGVLPPGVYIAVVSVDGAVVCRELVEVVRQ
jgi:hypothetical protein